ncbi:hypothetical protein DXG01_002828 [Tephrocybe rancida]|nr:hypothetical protein DXG01_002828 [Tephrocybe rancida]
MPIPSQVLVQILQNITSGAQPPTPQMLSTYEYFIKSRSDDLIQPIVMKKWAENSATTQRTQDNVDRYSVPTSFFDRVALSVFESLSPAELLEIEQSNKRVYDARLTTYKNTMKKLYHNHDTEDTTALATTAYVLQPVMAALEALTDLEMMSWAGGSVANGVGLVEISTCHRFSGPEEPPMIFPKSQSGIFRRAAQDWIAKVGDQAIDKWVGAAQQKISQSGAYYSVNKRKGREDYVGSNKRTRDSMAPTKTVVTRHMNGVSSESSHNQAGNSGHNSSPYSLTSSVEDGLRPGSATHAGIKETNELKSRKQQAMIKTKPSLDPRPRQSSSSSQVKMAARDGLQEMRPTFQTTPQEIQVVQHDLRPRQHQPPPFDQAGMAARDGLREIRSASHTSSRRQIEQGPLRSADGDEQYSALIATIPPTAKGLIEGLGTVTKGDLGSSYSALVTLLIEIEAGYGFKYTRKNGINCNNRPKEVSSWIQNGRGRDNGRRVIVDDIDKFAKEWWVWWMSLQPDWRFLDAHGRPLRMAPIFDEDWECLQKPGANGMLSVVASLHGWGLAITQKPVDEERKAEWSDAVEDCLWVMERLRCQQKNRPEEFKFGFLDDEYEGDTNMNESDFSPSSEP